MKRLVSLTLLMIVAMLPACGEMQTPSPSARNVVTVAKRAAQALLFVKGDSEDDILVWTFPDGRFVRSFMASPGARMCSDRKGNVYLAAVGLYEFDRKGNLIRGLLDNYGEAVACSVDPRTGNLAAFSGNNGGNLVVYQNATGNGTPYPTGIADGQSCAYDANGNLFALGETGLGTVELAELPYGKTSVTQYPLNARIPWPAAMQWDGQYLAVEVSVRAPHIDIDRIQVSGSTATVVSTVKLSEPHYLKGNPQFWIADGVIAAPYGRDNGDVGLWNYPAGGTPIRVIRSTSRRSFYAAGITVSIPH